MTARPNDRLRALRRQMRLTQADVAARVGELVEKAAGTRPGIDGDYVGRLERGRITWPSEDTRAALRQLYGVDSDADLGLYPRGVGQPTDVLPSRELSAADTVKLAEQATFGLLDALGLLQPHLLPAHRIGSRDVDELHAQVDRWEHTDHRLGGMSSFRTPVVSYVAQAAKLLKSASFDTDTIRRAWMVAVSRAARLAAFSSFDARDHATARAAFLLAQQVAAEADDWPARINILAGMARQAVYTGHGDQALRLVSLARVGEDFSSATTRAMIGSVRARSFAALGRPKDTLRAVREAEDAFADRDPSADPPYLWYYDDAQVLGDTGHALYDLAIDDEQYAPIADDHLEAAVSLHDPEATGRSRAFSLCKLTALRLRWDQSDTALVAPAIESVTKVQSGRALDGLAAVRQLLPTDDRAAAELGNRIAALTA